MIGCASIDAALPVPERRVWELGTRLWEDCQVFAQRDLSEHEIAYLFVVEIAERRRAAAKREPVLDGLGIHGRGSAGSAASHGRFEEGCRDRHGVL
jgi:hypothetical protein